MEVHSTPMEKTIRALLDGKKYQTLKDVLVTWEPADLAAIFEALDEERTPLLFRLLPKETAAETFAELPPENQELLIRGFSDRELHDLVNELYVDDAADLVEEMPANVVKRILEQADPQMRKEINEILRYPENSAGSIMTTEYISLRPTMTVEEAIRRIRKTGVDKETIYTCYVTSERKLLGTVSVKDLLLAEDDAAPVSQIMDENVISVGTLTDQEEVAQKLSKYNFLALPVLDTDGRMVGIVTFDDAMDVLVHQRRDLRLVVAREKQVLDGDRAEELSPLRDVTGVDGLLVYARPADAGDRLRHGHVRPQRDVLRRHDRAGGVFGIAQDLVDLLAHLRVCLSQNALDDVRGHLVDEIRRVVHVQLVDELVQFTVREAADQRLLDLAFELGKGLRRCLLGQQTEQKSHALLAEIVEHGGDVRRFHRDQNVLDGLVLFFVEQRADGLLKGRGLNSHRLPPPLDRFVQIGKADAQADILFRARKRHRRVSGCYFGLAKRRYCFRRP